MTKMDEKEFVQNFANQFDDTDASEFSMSTRFRDIDEWSSLIALGVIAMADEEYDVTLKGDDIIKSNTVEDIYNIVKSRM
jgi:acyl carrier protein